MSTLAIETAAGDLGIALLGEDAILSAFRASAAKRHVELLLPAVISVLEAAGQGVDDLDGVVVDIGPGLFTGLRAGVASAKGLALALGLPCVGIRSTAALRCAAEIFPAFVVSALDVRRGEVASEFPGDDRASIGGLHEALTRVETLVELGQVLLVGNGWRHERDAMEHRFGERVQLGGGDFDEPRAEVLARMGRAELLRGNGITAAALQVDYLRDADVAITWTTRHSEQV
jgi:tRNA threonylcarbamoyladenosine biosynthesis protein TsaB